MRTRNESLDALFLTTQHYASSKEFKELFEFFKKFKHMSVYNAMLVKIQKPGCMFATTAADWEKNYGRKIKPEATPLVILRPFGPVAFVYDLSDTTGKPVPEHILNPFEVHEDISSRLIERAIINMKAIGIDYTEKEQGSQSGGYIMRLEKSFTLDLTIKDKHYLIKKTHSLVVNKNLSSAAIFAIIAHELGHYFCGHLDFRKNLTDCQAEFEAECVKHIIFERLHIKSNSESYLWSFLDGNNQIPEISIDMILKAVGKIEAMYQSIQKPKKEVLAQ